MIILYADGGIEHATYKDDEQLRDIVCPKSRMLEPVQLAPDIYMWGDEEAKLFADHKLNHNASLLYRAVHNGDYLAGNVVLLGDYGGVTCDLSLILEHTIMASLHSIDRCYKAGKLGPAFVASGPHCEIRELTEDDLRAMFGCGEGKEA